MEEAFGILLTIVVIFTPLVIIFYFVRRRRLKNDSRLTPEEKDKKYTKEIATFIAITLGFIIKNLTGSWLIGGVTAGTLGIILLKYLGKKNE